MVKILGFNYLCLMKLLQLIITCCICFTACAQNPSIKTVDINTFEAGLKDSTVQLIDVRTGDEFDGGHLQGSINMNINSDEFSKKITALDKSKPVYVYCLSGGRSKTAANKLVKEGFTNIVNMDGGIMAWKYEAKAVVLDKPITNTGMSLDDFNKLISGDKPVLVEFYATWCGPCKILKPRVEQIAEKYKDKIKVIFIDVDKDVAIADEMNLRSIPVVQYYVKGKKSFSVTGLVSKDSLIKKMKL
jgi:thioredoxin 1